VALNNFVQLSTSDDKSGDELLQATTVSHSVAYVSSSHALCFIVPKLTKTKGKRTLEEKCNPKLQIFEKW